MINFTRFRLDNGLRVVVHEDKSTPLVSMNILYDAGSKDEDPSLTGMAHLFEHIMYCGTANIPEYDLPLQLSGGENNAFTNNDITNYYLNIPSGNIETAFWLESDRMFEPDFTQRKLDIQKSVVIEEFKQRYLNQPYGDVMLLLRPVVYEIHPYRWPTIGKEISHLERISLDDIKRFFSEFYSPCNAIMAISGNISTENAFDLTNKWFTSITRGKKSKRKLPYEPRQTSERRIMVERDVPSDALYMVWHMGPRLSDEYHTLDLITDLLAGGESGRLYNKLVRERTMFSEINAYITSDIDPGLVIFTGKLIKETDIMKAEKAVNEVINELKSGKITDREMNKVKNRFESSVMLSNTSIMNKSLNLAYYELLGDTDLVNREVDNYRNVSREMARNAAIEYLKPENCTTLFYMASKRK